jgi:hypothetical protein
MDCDESIGRLKFDELPQQTPRGPLTFFVGCRAIIYYAYMCGRKGESGTKLLVDTLAVLLHDKPVGAAWWGW